MTKKSLKNNKSLKMLAQLANLSFIFGVFNQEMLGNIIQISWFISTYFEIHPHAK
jgi:hypothetical protein